MVAVALTSLITLIGTITPYVAKGVLWAVGFKEELEKLSMTLVIIQGVLTHITEEQLEQELMQTWTRLLKVAVYDAEDLLGTLANVLRENEVLRPYSEIGIHLNVKKLNRKFDHIRDTAKLFPLVPTESGRDPKFLPTSHVDMSTVVGRKEDTEKIVKKLLDSKYDTEGNIPVICIVGMTGLGKTILAQLVYNDLKIAQRFEESNRIWVSVNENFDLSRILREMMMKSNAKISHKNLSPDQLCEAFLKFIRGIRFFLVLDNVWTEGDNEWKKLLFLLEKGANGSRVLITSQTIGLCRVPNDPFIYKLKLLSDMECWSLFQSTAFGQGKSCPPHLEEYGKKIVSKCQNLPLAVQAMGAFLGSNLDSTKWLEISKLDLLEAEKMGEFTGCKNPTILAALKVSYNHLPSPLKPLFRYCSMFPRGYLFDKKQLVQLWIAEDLIQQHEIRAEEIAGEHFNELVRRFFFQTSNVDMERYVMHDLFHELAESLSGPHYCLVENNRTREDKLFTKETRHVSLVCEDVEKPLGDMTDKSKKVRTLLLPGDNLKVFSPAIIHKLCKMEFIRVLDLSSSTILEVPNSIEKLKQLRYLNLSKTGITSLPDFICKLYNLQTLLLLGCASISILPKDLAKLINLRHLGLDQEFWRKIARLPPRIGTLTSLLNLHAFPVRREAGYGIEELKGMPYLTGTLHISNLENVVNAADAELNKKENLNTLVLEWSSNEVAGVAGDEAAVQAVKVLEDLQPHSELKELKIYHFRGTTFPHWMTSGQLQNLVAVSLKDHTSCKLLSLGQLLLLEKLKIQGMPKLEELQHSDGSYASLTLLKISDCPNLTKLPSQLPKLEDVEICYCPKLEALPELVMPKKLEIRGCKLLRALPVIKDSKQLQHLLLHECEDGTLISGIPETSSLKSLVLSNIAEVRTFQKWPCLPGLEALHIRGCKDLVSLSQEGSVPFKSFFTSLKFLSIQGCSQLVTLPNEGLPTTLEFFALCSCPNLHSLGPDDVLKSLTSLKDLYIKDCPKLQSLPEEGVSTSLKHLVIEGCPLLKERCTKEDGGGPDWQKIMHIPDLEIDFIGASSSSIDQPKASSMRWPHHIMKYLKGLYLSYIPHWI